NHHQIRQQPRQIGDISSQQVSDVVDTDLPIDRPITDMDWPNPENRRVDIELEPRLSSRRLVDHLDAVDEYIRHKLMSEPIQYLPGRLRSDTAWRPLVRYDRGVHCHTSRP